MPRVTVSTAGETVHTDYSVSTSPVSSFPTVDYATLAQPGDTFNQALNRLTSPARVRVPAGLYEIVNFTQGGGVYGCYAPLCQGIIGAGIDKTIIQLRPGSSTKANLVPVQSTKTTNPLTMMRLAKGQVISSGFTISGTEQPVDPNTGLPHLYGGWTQYMGNGSHVSDVKVTGIPGDWNSPPGETFANNAYRDVDTVFERVEVDGWIWLWTKNPDGSLTRTKGRRVGGSPLGGNASTRLTIRDCYFHDSYVSMLTNSFTGDPFTGAPSVDYTTERVRVENNGNTSTAGGKKASGMNHEGVNGNITHRYPTIVLTGTAYPHFAFNNGQADAQIEIIEPTWSGGPSWANGCLVMEIGDTYVGQPNKQVSRPRVVKNGVELIPAEKAPAESTSVLSYARPDTHYIVIR